MSIKLMMPFNHLILCSPPPSCPQSFPASESFPESQFLASGGQSIRASALASVLPVNIQDWFSLGLTGLISLMSDGLSKVFFSTTIWNISSSAVSFLYGQTLTSTHDYWKHYSFDHIDLWWQSDVSAFEYAVSFVIAFLPRIKCPLNLWLHSPSTLFWSPRK